MTDEELIESLRLWNRDDAADRIEALVKQLAVSNEIGRAFEEDAGQQRARAERLEAALREIEADCDADYPPSHGAIKQAARAALKGDDHE